MSFSKHSSHTASSDDIESAAESATCAHQLSSTKAGDSEVEQIAERIEQRRAERVCTTFKARVRFLKDCRQIAQSRGYDKARISKTDLKKYRDRVCKELESGKGIYNHAILKGIGIKSDIECLEQIVERAVQVVESGINGAWFHYMDFSHDHTRVVSRWPWMRHELRVAAIVVFLYYLFTPILFCNIMQEPNICDGDGYTGWVSALYFASTTMSTVGYGDLTVEQEPKYSSFIGSLYMLVSVVVAVVAFSAAASATLFPLEKFFNKIFERFNPKPEKEQFLYERMRRVRFIRITELLVEIFTFIAVGVFASRIAVYFDDEPLANWTWMTSFYWAVQTTTTIGYGDLVQPFGLRYFKIFYLMFGTVLVGNALGKLGALKHELSEVRRRHAWDRRPVTKRMIDEMQAYDHDDKVDQFEFLVSSLISLGKLSSDDISPIMDKYRNLAGSKGFISIDDNISDADVGDSDNDDIEDDVIDAED